MKPTNQLRFVEREVREYVTEDMARVFKNRVLQQWWASVDYDKLEILGEWRDVPLEAE